MEDMLDEIHHIQNVIHAIAVHVATIHMRADRVLDWLGAVLKGVFKQRHHIEDIKDTI